MSYYPPNSNQRSHSSSQWNGDRENGTTYYSTTNQQRNPNYGDTATGHGSVNKGNFSQYHQQHQGTVVQVPPKKNAGANSNGMHSEYVSKTNSIPNQYVPNQTFNQQQNYGVPRQQEYAPYPNQQNPNYNSYTPQQIIPASSPPVMSPNYTQSPYGNVNQGVGASPAWREKVSLKIVILGNSGVGKTSLMNRYHSNKFTGQYKATIGADFLSREITIPSPSSSMPRKCMLQIWDTAGQERFQSLGTSFYRGADACLLVYDVTDMKSFEGIDRWREEFLRQVGIGTDNDARARDYGGSGIGGGHTGASDNRPFPFVLLGNKMDKHDACDNLIRSSAEKWCQSKSGCNGRSIPFFETSAKTAMNVQQAFSEAASMALHEIERRERTEPKTQYPPAQTIDLNRGGDYEESKEKCC